MGAREDFTVKVTAEQDLKEVSEQAMPVPTRRANWAEGTLSTDLGSGHAFKEQLGSQCS